MPLLPLRSLQRSHRLLVLVVISWQFHSTVWTSFLGQNHAIVNVPRKWLALLLSQLHEGKSASILGQRCDSERHSVHFYLCQPSADFHPVPDPNLNSSLCPWNSSAGFGHLLHEHVWFRWNGSCLYDDLCIMRLSLIHI